MNLNSLMLILWILFFVNITADMELTEYALEDDYYETNPFTDSYSPILHWIILIVLSMGMVKLSEDNEERSWFTIQMFLAGVIIWTFNNGFSLFLLFGGVV